MEKNKKTKLRIKINVKIVLKKRTCSWQSSFQFKINQAKYNEIKKEIKI